MDDAGRVIHASPESADAARTGGATRAVAAPLQVAGEIAGLGALLTFTVRGAASSSVAAISGGALLRVDVDPATTTLQVEKALLGWTPSLAGDAAPRTFGSPASATATPTSRAAPPPVPPAPATAPTPTPTPAPAARPGADAWAALRRTLGRGQLSEAVSRQHELAGAARPGRAGSEPVHPDACERTVRALLQGIGSVMAGDGPGGARILADLAAPSQKNLSFRWIALQWSTRAALKSGAIPAARAHVQEALTVARDLDIDARALSQWTAAEVLAHDSDPTRALAWLGESRNRFERVGDRWGIGQTWLSQARVLTAAKREGEAAESARRAAELLPDSDEPAVVLARLALSRDDLAAAEELLLPFRSQSAERIRALIEAIRAGTVTREDASELLREQEAPASGRALRALERIAKAAPRLPQAREVLAWTLLKLSRYEEADALFRGLLSHPLSPADRASVTLGLGCIANARRSNGAGPHVSAVVAAAASPGEVASDDLPPLPPLSQSAILARGSVGAAADAVFSGQLSSFAIPDLLEFLRSARRTGLLVCSSASGIGALRFRDGRITSGASPGAPSLGELLVGAGKLSAQALRALAAVHGEVPDGALGEHVVRESLADAASVREAVERQIGVVVRELVHWKDGEFAFNRDPDGAAEPKATSVALDPQAVLLEALTEMDEAARDAAALERP
jgi:hypothetical protein